MTGPVRASARGANRAAFPRAVGVVILLGVAAPTAALGQDVRGSVRATANYLEIAPMRQDTVARAAVTDDPDLGPVFEGRPVTCVLVDRCTFYRADDPVAAVGLAQDVSATAWGLGVRGLSVTAFGRVRQDVGGDLSLPRADDSFDLLLGYAELTRDRWGVRLGRLRSMAGLGFAGYDGAEVRLDPGAALRLTGYAGRSLARGLEESRETVLEPIESFVPDGDAWLFGAALRWRHGGDAGVEVRYQRDLMSDRSVLLSERAALDARVRVRAVEFEVSADYDVALASLGKAHLSAVLPVRDALVLRATARRYRPWFELWTIWGFFSPVAYHEAQLEAGWSVAAHTQVRAGFAWRAYQDAHATVVFDPLEDDAIRATVGAVTTQGPVTASATYRLERAVGAFLSAGDAEVRWRPIDRFEVGAQVGATQQIMEFRLGDERILGVGGSVRWRAGDRVVAAGGATLHAHQLADRPATGDWDQLRGWAALEIAFGDDPALLDDIVPAAPLPEGYWPRSADADERDDVGGER